MESARPTATEIESLIKPSSITRPQPKRSVTTQQVIERRERQERLLLLRLRASKLGLITALTSIIVMITNTQLILLGVYSTCSDVSIGLKGTVSALTFILIILVWIYNYLQLEIFKTLRNIQSLRIAFQVNLRRTLLLVLETIITIPHPLPICLLPVMSEEVSPFMNEHEDKDNEYNMGVNFTTAAVASLAENTTGGVVDGFHYQRAKIHQLDSIFAILMFARLYHVARFSVLHSKLFRTMLSYSLGALAHTKYNFMFIFKSYMAIYKGYFLAAIALSFTFIAAWCIYISDKDITNYEDALWVVGITFFTVGK